jgi:hypothetical protein
LNQSKLVKKFAWIDMSHSEALSLSLLEFGLWWKKIVCKFLFEFICLCFFEVWVCFCLNPSLKFESIFVFLSLFFNLFFLVSFCPSLFLSLWIYFCLKLNLFLFQVESIFVLVFVLFLFESKFVFVYMSLNMFSLFVSL